MRWIEAAIPTRSEEIDELGLRLVELGVGGFSIEDEADFKGFLEHNHQYWDYVDEGLDAHFSGLSQIKFYLPDDEEGKKKLGELREALGRLFSISYVEDSDWENNWREYYKPLEIGEKLLIVPEWDREERDGRISLVLDPGLLFGTGSHATTRMCLCALQEVSPAGRRVLDLGCGSGILGIGACLLGCKSLTGCDIDPKAPDVAAANAALNGIGPDRFRIYAGDILSDEALQQSIGGGYEIVLANIVADVIIPLSAIAPRFLTKPGIFITSGIIDGREDEVMRALTDNGFTIIDHKHEDEWHCLVCINM